MNTTDPSTTGATLITATRVADADRIRFLPAVFGRHMLAVEAVVYHVMGNLCREYSGGYWEFMRLSNGGGYLRPPRGSFTIESPNGYAGTVSCDAIGIIVTLFALSELSFEPRATETLARRYHQLREYALDHQEASDIFRAID